MKPFFHGHGLFRYVDGINPCPFSHISVDNTNPLEPNLAYSLWVQQDQLIMSTLIASLSIDMLTLVVDLPISCAIWTTLETTIAFPFDIRIMEIHIKPHDLEQKDDSISIYF